MNPEQKTTNQTIAPNSHVWTVGEEYTVCWLFYPVDIESGKKLEALSKESGLSFSILLDMAIANLRLNAPATSQENILDNLQVAETEDNSTDKLSYLNQALDISQDASLVPRKVTPEQFELAQIIQEKIEQTRKTRVVPFYEQENHKPASNPVSNPVQASPPLETPPIKAYVKPVLSQGDLSRNILLSLEELLSVEKNAGRIEYFSKADDEETCFLVEFPATEEEEGSSDNDFFWDTPASKTSLLHLIYNVK